LIDTLLNLVFRCAHRRLTRPVTPVTKGETTHAGTYVVCLDCGKQFSYDPKEMRLGRAIEPSQETCVAIPPEEMSSGGRLKRTLVAAVPAVVVFFLALFGIKRDRTQR
jgi:DNA-directed RNA polymerase subunit RPC12/RpoP